MNLEEMFQQSSIHKSHNRRFYKHIHWAKIVWDYYNPHNKSGIGYNIHHIDGNTLNDNINNLRKMTIKEHASLHLKGRVLSDETKEKLSIASRKRKPPSEETRKKMSISAKNRGVSWLKGKP